MRCGRNSDGGKGKTSGVTRTSVVILKGLPDGVGYVSSTKAARQPCSGTATRATYVLSP